MFRLRREAKANYQGFADNINNLKLEAIKVQSENSDLSTYIYGHKSSSIRNRRNTYRTDKRGPAAVSAARLMFEKIDDYN